MNRLRRSSRTLALAASCVAVFWHGAFVFGLPGVMVPTWQAMLRVGGAEVGRILFFLLAGVGIFMFLAGRWQEKIGAPVLVCLGVLVCGAATIMLAYASTILVIYVWAFLVGASSCLVYVPGLTVVQNWFPHRRGLVSGLVSMSFGVSAAIMSPVFEFSLTSFGYAITMIAAGLAASFVGLAVSPFVRFPEKKTEPHPAGSIPTVTYAPAFTVAQSLHTPAFWFIWVTWALGGAAGIAMVTLSTTFGVSKGLRVQEAVILLTAFNMTNGICRLISGHLSDFMGRKPTMCVSFLAAGGAYFLLPNVQSPLVWAILTAVVGFAFGTLFAVSAPMIGDFFGMKHFGAVFGLIFTAYGFAAGVLGPWLSGYLLDVTGGNFTVVFTYLGFLYLVSALFIYLARPHPARTAKAV